MYICARVDHTYWKDFWDANGYWSNVEFVRGELTSHIFSDQEYDDEDLTSAGDELITWEGINNISYDELTGKDIFYNKELHFSPVILYQ